MTQRLTPQQQRLCEEHLSLAINIATKMISTNPYLDRDDAISDATSGLIAASVKYDPTKSKFMTYATYKIKGAVRDGARRRSVYYRMASRIGNARYAFAAREYRFPNDQELALEVKLSIEQLQKCKQFASISQPRHLDEVLRSTGGSTFDLDVTLADETADPEDPYEQVNSSGDWRVLDSLLDRLPSTERFVIGMHFWERMTLGEIGELLGVTESRIGQIRAAALKKLREWAPVELQEQLV